MVESTLQIYLEEINSAALLTADGTLIPGYVPPAQLRERLDTMAEAATAAE